MNVIRLAVQTMTSSNRTHAYFRQKYLWLEEYPLEKSAPGLFVLNGCLYALIGLFDANTIDPNPEISRTMDTLLMSLNELLPLFIDPKQSNWSLYDLGHLTIGTKINRASYSYHLVHITLLHCLSELFRRTHRSISILFNDYAQRFRSAVSVQDSLSIIDHFYAQENNK